MNYLFYVLVSCLVFSCTHNEPKQQVITQDAKPAAITAVNTPVVLSPDKHTGNYYMRVAKAGCDSFLSAYFGKTIFQKHLRWNKKTSFINCKSGENIEVFDFNDSVPCIPHLYDFSYFMIQDADTIYDFRIDCDSSLVFIMPSHDYWQGKYSAYRFLLNGDFEITFQEARAIGTRHGFARHMTKLELNYDQKGKINSRSSYYWELQPKIMIPGSKHKAMRINPNTGEAKVHSISISSIDDYSVGRTVDSLRIKRPNTHVWTR